MHMHTAFLSFSIQLYTRLAMHLDYWFIIWFVICTRWICSSFSLYSLYIVTQIYRVMVFSSVSFSRLHTVDRKFFSFALIAFHRWMFFGEEFLELKSFPINLVRVWFISFHSEYQITHIRCTTTSNIIYNWYSFGSDSTHIQHFANIHTLMTESEWSYLT